MHPLGIAFLAGIALLLIAVNMSVSKGLYQATRAQPTDRQVVERLRRLGLWTSAAILVFLLVALFLFPNKSEVLMVGGAVFVMFDALWSLRLAAQAGKISERTYVIGRVSLIPVLVILLILVGDRL